jgi:hypothetical protein
MKKSISSKGLRFDIWSEARKMMNNDVRMSMEIFTLNSASLETGAFGGGVAIASEETNKVSRNQRVERMRKTIITRWQLYLQKVGKLDGLIE